MIREGVGLLRQFWSVARNSVAAGALALALPRTAGKSDIFCIIVARTFRKSRRAV